jgi:EAL domain-containing protein (putative c-di-GMP-specific phosphodiesterase class I)
MLPVLERLRAGGFTLAMDDFGAGYSSLGRLRALDVQVIKVDRTFLVDVPHNAQANAVVTAILRLAEACECDVVAEGIETEEQLDFLVANGCGLGQGFLLGRPAPAAEVTRFLADRLAGTRRRAA